MKFIKYAFLLTILLLGGFYALNATAATEHENTVQKAYIAYYGRPADPAGLDYWVGRLEAANGDLAGLINEFGNSDEYKERFGNLDNETLIKNIYQNLFNRDPDQAGLDYYKNQLETGQATLANISLDILNGATGSDSALINNKVDIANRYTNIINNDNSIIYNSNQAKTIIANSKIDNLLLMNNFIEKIMSGDEILISPSLEKLFERSMFRHEWNNLDGGIYYTHRFFHEDGTLHTRRTIENEQEYGEKTLIGKWWVDDNSICMEISPESEGSCYIIKLNSFNSYTAYPIDDDLSISSLSLIEYSSPDGLTGDSLRLIIDDYNNREQQNRNKITYFMKGDYMCLKLKENSVMTTCYKLIIVNSGTGSQNFLHHYQYSFFRSDRL